MIWIIWGLSACVAGVGGYLLILFVRLSAARQRVREAETRRQDAQFISNALDMAKLIGKVQAEHEAKAKERGGS